MSENTMTHGITPLKFEKNGRDGSLWARVNIGHGFTAHYTIKPIRTGYSLVGFGVMYHEFSDQIVWFGPTEKAEKYAQLDHVERVTAIIKGVLEE